MAPVAARSMDTVRMNGLHHLDYSDEEEEMFSCRTGQTTIKASNVRRVTVRRKRDFGANTEAETAAKLKDGLLLLLLSPSRPLLLIPLTIHTPLPPSDVARQEDGAESVRN